MLAPSIGEEYPTVIIMLEFTGSKLGYTESVPMQQAKFEEDLKAEKLSVFCGGVSAKTMLAAFFPSTFSVYK